MRRPYKNGYLSTVCCDIAFDKKIAIWADTPVDVAIKRNNARSRVVPEPVILSMSSTLEIPTKSEGFDKVRRFDSDKQQFFDMSSDKNVRIYIDMDGVVADFEKGVKDAGVELSPMGGSAGPEKANEFWGALGRVPNFYYNLEPIPEGVEMVKKLMEKYECVFLTGIPRAENEMMTAQLDKIKWAKKYFGDDAKVYPVKRYTKARFCNGRNSILIDDYMKNIREWEEAGGSGVQFKPDKDILKSVEQIVERNERNIGQQKPTRNQSQVAFYGYDALFIKADVIEKLRKSLGIQDKQLANKPHDYHVTMKYHGKHEPTDKEKEFQTKNNGQQMKCTIIGYGNDGKNEGFLCKGYQKDGRTPFHITLSIADGARAVDTGKMSFTKFEKPIEISGRFYNSLDIHVQNPAYQTFARNSSEVRREPNKIKEKEDTREI